jgi:hypothetical protein
VIEEDGGHVMVMPADLVAQMRVREEFHEKTAGPIPPIFAGCPCFTLTS